MVHKLDRLSRSLIDFSTLIQWCQGSGKTVISVSESLDFSTPVGRMFASFLAAFAQFERERIAERRADHARHARQLARWDGRSIPTGYRPVTVNNHFELEPEPVAAALVCRMAGMVIAGTSARQVAAALNTEGVPTLRYGHSVRVGRITCTPLRRGMRCSARPSGHGFLAARSGIRRF